MNGEINSPILKDCKSSWKELKNVLEMLIKNEGMVSEKCGGHVNIGANIFENNDIYWRNFFLLWILYEQEIYKFSSGEYKSIRYNIDSFIENISYNIKIEDILNVSRVPYLYMIGCCLFDNDIDKHNFLIQTFKTNKIYKKELLPHKYYY